MKNTSLQAQAFQIAEYISIKTCKKLKPKRISHLNNDELFYEEGKGKYLYVFKYGAVCFMGFSKREQEEIIVELLEMSRNPLAEPHSENIMIKIAAKKEEIGFNSITLTELSSEMIRLIMLNVTQSVALDYYSEMAENLLEETRKHTNELERKGSITIHGKRLKKFIGRTLNLKNRISENLYVLDAPPETWEDERLDRIDSGLKKTFDIKNRYAEISEDISIVKDNLELFKNIMQHREQAVLEIIIIVLILVEVIDVFVAKFL